MRAEISRRHGTALTTSLLPDPPRRSRRPNTSSRQCTRGSRRTSPAWTSPTSRTSRRPPVRPPAASSPPSPGAKTGASIASALEVARPRARRRWPASHGQCPLPLARLRGRTASAAGKTRVAVAGTRLVALRVSQCPRRRRRFGSSRSERK